MNTEETSMHTKMYIYSYIYTHIPACLYGRAGFALDQKRSARMISAQEGERQEAPGRGLT